jgi:hypothetical protein
LWGAEPDSTRNTRRFTVKQFKVKLAAQYAQDGSGRPYAKYCIPDPKSYEEYVNRKAALNAMPRDQIGSSMAADPVPSPKSMELERGGVPIELVVCEELLNHLKTHRKSLSIYDVEEISSAPAKGARG